MHLQTGGMQGGALGQAQGARPNHQKRCWAGAPGDATKATDASQMGGKFALTKDPVPTETEDKEAWEVWGMQFSGPELRRVRKWTSRQVQ